MPSSAYFNATRRCRVLLINGKCRRARPLRFISRWHIALSIYRRQRRASSARRRTADGWRAFFISRERRRNTADIHAMSLSKHRLPGKLSRCLPISGFGHDKNDISIKGCRYSSYGQNTSRALLGTSCLCIWLSMHRG